MSSSGSARALDSAGQLAAHGSWPDTILGTRAARPANSIPGYAPDLECGRSTESVGAAFGLSRAVLIPADAYAGGFESLLEDLRRWAGVKRHTRTSNRPLTEGELAELASASFVEIGAHSVEHPALASLPLSAQREEIEASKRFLERALGRKVDHFAYPFGRGAWPRWTYGRESVRLVREAGYTAACALRPALHLGVRLHELPRLIVRNWDGRRADPTNSRPPPTGTVALRRSPETSPFSRPRLWSHGHHTRQRHPPHQRVRGASVKVSRLFENLRLNDLNQEAPGRLGGRTRKTRLRFMEVERRTEGRWCLKDPRLSETAHHFYRHISAPLKVIFNYRHPGSTVRSLIREREEHESYLTPEEMLASAEKEWLGRNRAALEFLDRENRSPLLITRYDDLVDRDLDETLCRFVGRSLDFELHRAGEAALSTRLGQTRAPRSLRGVERAV